MLANGYMYHVYMYQNKYTKTSPIFDAPNFETEQYS